jgi:spoIIIJ-associated protein
MSETRTSLEVIAPTVEEAVAKGLSDLGLSENAVEIEVLDAGTRGLFGLGSRQARVRLTIKAEGEPPSRLTPELAISDSQPSDAMPVSIQPAPVVIAEREPSPAQPGEETVPAAGEDHEEDAHILNTARETVVELLQMMKVRAKVEAKLGEADDAHSKAPVMVDIYGDDLSILIGPRAETLNALQYIAGLIVGKELGRSVPLVVDVQGFRARRAQQIQQLARRMAEQAIKTGRRQVLEPMPANERRLVHIELRNHPDVTTESVGEEPRRKVTIVPK